MGFPLCALSEHWIRTAEDRLENGPECGVVERIEAGCLKGD